MLVSLLVFLLMRSPWGRVLKAIREDEDAVRSLGKNVVGYKMQSLVLGGVFGALGGFVFALANSSVQPDNYSTLLTFFAFTAMILGGAGRILGPVVGAILFSSFFIVPGERAGAGRQRRRHPDQPHEHQPGRHRPLHPGRGPADGCS